MNPTTSSISSLNFYNAPRTGIARLQRALATATAENASLRLSDLGLALGARTGLGFGLRQQVAEIDAIADGNRSAAARLTTSQDALKKVQADADASLKTLLGLPAEKRAAAAAATAGSQLATLTDLLNTSSAGQFVFGGTNTTEQPLRAYGGSPLKVAVAAAFQNAFGFAQGDPRAAGVSAAQLTAFIDGPLALIFDGPGWSQASGVNLEGRISLSETAETSANANAAPLRKLARAYVAASDLGLTGFSAAAQTAAADRIASLFGEASTGLVAMQADLGRVQARITDADTRLETQKALLNRQVDALEAVDPAEAKARVDALTTQVQISYALTAQMRCLSLVAYLS